MTKADQIKKGDRQKPRGFMTRNKEFEFVFLTTKEAAEFLRLSARTLEAKRRNGKGPPFTRMGNDQNAKVVYRLSGILEWLADKTHVKVVPTSKCGTSQTAQHDRERPGSEEEDSWIDALLTHNARAN
ncbi:helix-turn-helix transcriptional regulator [Hyphomicrobium sp. LHD-15]|uniref:helix-turn-helix transcriptional regulator n=1 Tax=Hyphomicrobium sp. LHD-15 TaxID=3072142 RepID=UPI0035BE4947